MTQAERVSAVATLGFTERQAALLVLVMLHAGVCVGRQYCAFAGIVRGQKMADFFQKLAARRYATPYPCGHNKARIYHVTTPSSTTRSASERCGSGSGPRSRGRSNAS